MLSFSAGVTVISSSPFVLNGFQSKSPISLTSSADDVLKNTLTLEDDLIFEVNLGDKSKIKKIEFIGDKKIKDRTLRRIIISEEAKFWKFISNN